VENDEKAEPRADGALLADDRDEPMDDGPDGPDGDHEDESPGQPGDGKAEDALEVLSDLLEHMDLDAKAGIRDDGERIVLDVSGEDAGRAIGKKGQTLDALQFLVNKIVNRFPTGRRHVVVDSGDYRQRKDDGLMTLARREAKRAVQLGKVVTLKPMSARDRRVIHMSLAKVQGVSTRSNGVGMGRRIQIIPSRTRPTTHNRRGPRREVFVERSPRRDGYGARDSFGGRDPQPARDSYAGRDSGSSTSAERAPQSDVLFDGDSNDE